MTTVSQAHYSRFQVLCAERAAWAQPALRRETRFYFDGFRFWASSKGEERQLPSWRAPRYGWLHELGCDCALCASRGQEATPQLLAS